ncbi:group-specific protein [Brevibacillus humidisoli]|uniref:group-specific protein n=1 Tax=Brevibacillus humidisoli TaxID=2895522 RepID=UPI001E4F7496|nr:group-specific protein [Brevibacillus humidisoli]UFJ39707.1 group-specific protein [Brevibacillus humidisoli]
MGECKIDHSQDDVLCKLETQHEHLPNDLYQALKDWLGKPQPQSALNEVFHLLKKYDLAAKAEQAERDRELRNLLSQA